MKLVKVVNPRGESLLNQLASLYLTFKNVHGNVIFDLSDVTWIFPILILPIASYIHDTGSDFRPPVKPEVSSYLGFVKFPRGVSSVGEMRRGGNYIPITLLKDESPVDRARLQDEFLKMIYKVLNSSVEVKNAIYYPVEELVENIFQHSGKNEGHVFAQYYPTKEFLDLCIVDRGIGLAASYKKGKGLNLDDEEAIEMALRGYSVKPEESRGYGIRTSKRVVCEGLNGEFVLISGRAALYSSKHDVIYDLPDFYWQGVIVAYRIPKPKHPVDIYPFLER
ncbi:hypothetical protein GBV73_02765 [Thermococcus sp. 101 C5]|uniref:hypothetical protein n=1 Tax=Thermococcus sp. 101 C5 TaxID=2654197 RepID=UPI00128BCC03|nr:hypothetical protein [Thermococcus sp. 101 C5]MPW38623.1 hypothetical protein [Thermococcus sp. 101 C5]